MATRSKQQAKRVNSPAQALHKALSHELRVEILTLLTERTTASPVEMAKELGAPVGDVSHHVKQLVKYGCAEQVETRPRRGAIEHFYRATSRPVVTTEDMEKLALTARRAFNGQVAQKVLGDLQQGFEASTLEGRPDHQLTRVPLSLDAEGYEELLAIHKRALEETYDVQARSDERRSESGEEALRFSSCQLCFELPSA